MNGPTVIALVLLAGIGLVLLVIGLDALADRISDRRRDRRDERAQFRALRNGLERDQR